MGARQKLNASHFKGALVVAAVIGGLSGSWLVFGLAAAALVVSGVMAGDIRTRPGA